MTKKALILVLALFLIIFSGSVVSQDVKRVEMVDNFYNPYSPYTPIIMNEIVYRPERSVLYEVFN